MHNKHLTRLFFIFTFIFLSTGAYLLLPDKPKTETPKPEIQNLPWTDVVTSTAISENKITQNKNLKPEIQKTETTSPVSEEIKNPIETTIEINSQQHKVSLPEKSTAYDAMQKLTNTKQITMTTKQYNGLGYFIEEINGLKNNNQTGEYWIYYINGQSAKVGVSLYILKNNDLIKWTYAKAQF
ncbi:MAG: DUF4430 domain-containing protein [Candidatus Magasanikbacteria bacterium]